jgi:hypothetical protein
VADASRNGPHGMSPGDIVRAAGVWRLAVGVSVCASSIGFCEHQRPATWTGKRTGHSGCQ